jgi:hypothetical protein
VVGALALLPLAAALTACGDPFGTDQSLLRTDSLALAAVNGPLVGFASAVDVTANDAPTQPELPGEAGSWDVQVRLQSGAFVLVPNQGNGTYRGAGLAKTTRTPDDPGNAPRESSAYTRTAVQVAAGDAFYVESRQLNATCGSVPKFGLIMVKSLAADSGVAHLVVRSNQACNDERLQ